jgi:class 3 adenylate cyclase
MPFGMSPEADKSRSSPSVGADPGELNQEPPARRVGGASALPGGTVTFAFTDIEGSTLLLRRLGEDRYADLLGRHRQIVRGAFYAADGIEIDRQGDACFFALPRAQDAVAAAVEIQRAHASTAWPQGLSVRVRVGLHTGEPSIGAEGYLGIDVVKGARICDAARGSQVLLSATTHALTASKLPPAVSIAAAGERHLKGIERAEPLYLLVISEAATAKQAEGAFPPIIPTEWERQIEERFGTAGTKLARSIGARIAGSLSPDGVTASHAAAADWKAVKDESLEHLARRAVTSLNTKIRAGATAAFRTGPLRQE